nr:hypothetical protein [Mycobacterium lacus]
MAPRRLPVKCRSRPTLDHVANTLRDPVDFVLLDGWKELYLPVIKLLDWQLTI